MINIKKTEPKIQSGKKVINVKDAYINDDNILCDESGAVFEQLKPELPPNISINFKISIDLDDLEDETDDKYTDGADDNDDLPF